MAPTSRRLLSGRWALTSRTTTTSRTACAVRAAHARYARCSRTASDTLENWRRHCMWVALSRDPRTDSHVCKYDPILSSAVLRLQRTWSPAEMKSRRRPRCATPHVGRRHAHGAAALSVCPPAHCVRRYAGPRNRAHTATDAVLQVSYLYIYLEMYSSIYVSEIIILRVDQRLKTRFPLLRAMRTRA